MNSHKVSDWLEIQDNGALVILKLKSKRLGEAIDGVPTEFIYGMDRTEALMFSTVLNRVIFKEQSDAADSSKS